MAKFKSRIKLFLIDFIFISVLFHSTIQKTLFYKNFLNPYENERIDSIRSG